MIRTNVTEVHLSVREATALADLMQENGRTSIATALDTAVAHASVGAGRSAEIGLVVDSMVSP